MLLPLVFVSLSGMPAFGESSGLITAPAAAAPNQPAASKPVLFKGGGIVTLDCIEQLEAKNSPRDRFPCIAHCQAIPPGDIARLGPVRDDWQYPYARLAKTGATLAFNSDWPACRSPSAASNRARNFRPFPARP